MSDGREWVVAILVVPARKNRNEELILVEEGWYDTKSEYKFDIEMRPRPLTAVIRRMEKLTLEYGLRTPAQMPGQFFLLNVKTGERIPYFEALNP